MWGVFLDALVDTAKIVPVLLLIYILISYFTHKTNKPFNLMIKKGKYYGPLLGATLGTIPQCGFSAIMADLYSKKAITVGTLFAVFLTTSDEALPILIANPIWYKELFILLGVKFIIGIIFGYVIDFIFQFILKRKQILSKDVPNKFLNKECTCVCEHCHKENEIYQTNIDCCADNTFLDALIRTVKITFFILIFNIIFGIIIYYIGMDSFINFVSINPYLQPLATTLIGLIPNCVASVFLIEMYMAGGITFASAIAGLSTGAGIGLIILFKQNKNIKENLLIMFLLYIIGVIIGISLTPIL